MPYSPPPTVVTGLTFGAASWAASTAYTAGQIYRSPQGDYRLVKAAYTSGTSYGSQDTTYTVPTSDTYSQLGTQFAPLGATYRQAIAATGALVSLGQPIRSNGLSVIAPVTVTDLQIMLDFPAIGSGATVFRFTRFRPSDQSELVLGTVSVAAGKRSDSNSNNNSGTASLTNTSLLAGDILLVRNLSMLNTGYTFAGQGVTAVVSFSGTFTNLPTPSAPTGFSATGGTNSVTLNWTAGTSSTGTLVLVDGIPTAIVGGTTWTHTGLVFGTDNHTYTIAAISPGSISAISSGIQQAPVQIYNYYSQSNGAPVSTDFQTTLGTNSGTAATVTSNLLTLTSGSVGSSAQQDRVAIAWVKDTAAHTYWRRTWKMGYTTASTVDWFFGSDTFTGFTMTLTHYLQLEIAAGASQYRIGYKAPSINSGGFVALTATATGMSNNATSGGYVNFPSTMTLNGTLYGISMEILPPSGGQTVINLRYGTAASVDDGSILTSTPVNVVTLSTAYTSALVAGQHWWQLQGSGSTGAAENYSESSVALTVLG